MHVRISRVRRNGKTYEYPQLVESYRRPDGMPVHRVVASLGSLSPEQVENIKVALDAGRQGQQVAAEDEAAQSVPPSPTANLRYLDLAVLLEVAKDGGLASLLASLLPKDEAAVAPSDVVLSLVLQRCVDPGSKLYAERWFPRTALPELLGIESGQFNNTRVHRVLEQLEAVTRDLMARLPQLYLQRSKRAAFASMYVDLTDAHFVGHGPDMAIRGKTKGGFVARKIGILLLCNEQGYPLRWTVLEGNRSESSAMTELYQQIANTPWAQQTPIICDRAMGHTAQIKEMDDTGLHFLTALTSQEFGSYAPQLPASQFSDLEPTESSQDDDVKRAMTRAKEAGFERATDTLWVMDCGTVKIALSSEACESDTEGETIASTFRIGRDVQQAVDDGRFTTFNAASRSMGIPPSTAKKYRTLLRLPADVQQSILDGKAERMSLGELVRLVSLPTADAQRDAYEQLSRTSTAFRKRKGKPLRRPNRKEQTPPLCVRAMAYFNPERFVEQHINEARKRADIDAFIAQLNRRLASGRSRRTRASVLGEVDRRLRRDNLLDAYTVEVESAPGADGKPCHRVVCSPIHKAWARRRYRYGMSVLVGHRDLKQSAHELCKLYRAKDCVEKDFQTIKSVVELRPIRHRNDLNVRAHVTLCMLALLLERQLEAKLGALGTAPAALEELAPCHLNLYRGSRNNALYALTKTTQPQRRLLRKLGVRPLGDTAHVSATLSPRLHLRD